ncbi:hypothetical protein CB1_000228040 [Camelus ferus]|nr:hypothetical protein CB1_000228040 [Camelus ferus]
MEEETWRQAPLALRVLQEQVQPAGLVDSGDSLSSGHILLLHPGPGRQDILPETCSVISPLKDFSFPPGQEDLINPPG